MKKKNFIRLLKALFVLMAMLPAVQTASALGQKELQELLDSPSAMTTRAGDGFKEIDLSDFTEPLTTTMYVRAQNVRFVNGTLTRSTNFTTNAPLISIQNGYTLEIDYSVRLCGSFIGKPLVDIEAGTFRMSGGGITDNTHSTSINLSGGVNSSCIINTGFQPPVVIHLAEISGGIDNPSGGFVYISNSEVEFVNTSNAINLWGGTIQDNVKLLNSTAKVNLETSLTNDLWITGYAKDQAIVTGYNGYNITNDDLAKIHISNTDYTLSLENNSVYVREGSNPVRTINDVEPGSLPDLIPETDRSIIEELTITGKLNGTDIKLIREMACKKLKKLDISGCSIVEGGDVYVYYSICAEPCFTTRTVSYPATGVYNNTKTRSTKNDVIGQYMFAGLSTLETLFLPNTVVTIEGGAFIDSPNLTTIMFGSSVNNILSGFLFYGSNNVRNVYFNSSNTSFIVNNGAIYNKAKSIIVSVLPTRTGTFGIENTVDSITHHAFAGCMGITTITFNGNPIRINDFAFCQSGLKSIYIPSTVKHIGEGAFMFCEELSSVTFTENIESIGYGAFAYSQLNQVDLSATKVAELGGDEHSYPIGSFHYTLTYHVGVFEGTETITTVKLPSTIKEIGGKVFTSPHIENIYCHSFPPTIWYKYTYSAQGQLGGYGYAVSDTFSDIYSTCRLHVPSNTVTYYKESTGWKEFYNIIGDQTPVADPNTITNEDDLQRRLDEIAEQNPTNPVEIKICTEGITLTKGIYAKGNCKAIISGGPISVTQGYNKNALFSVQYNAYLRFSNISFDLLNFRQRQSCFYVMERGVLEIDGSVEYKNMSSNTVLGWGREQGFYVNAGKIILYGGDASGIEGNVISNCGVVEMSGDIFKYGINIYNYMVSSVDIYLGTIRLLSAIPESSVWTINGNWDAYPLETPFIESTTNYTIQASDYWQMRFTGLGEVNSDCEGVIQYYDGTPHNIKLKEYHDLQCELDKLENNSARIDCRGVDVGHDITIEERLQMELDGYCDDDAAGNIAPIWMPGGCMFFEPTVPQVVFNDIIFDSYSNGHRIYVRTKVEYRRNVRARNFLWFTIVEKGGQLTWRNAWTENVLYPIYNDGGLVDILGGNLTGTSYNLNGGVFGIWSDTKVNIIDNNAMLNLGGNVSIKEIKQGPLGKIILTSKLYNKWTIDLTGHITSDYYDGQFIMEGGSGYVLTATDLALLDFRLPAGCSVSLDTAHNAIVLHIATFPLGDVNLDFAVDVADISTIISLMAGSADISSAYADVNGDGAVNVADISTIIDIMAGKISSTPANLKTVNLGLPSGTLWANMNVGATSPEDYGSYLAWGETEEKTSYGWNNYKWCNGSQTTMTKYCTSTEYGINDGNMQLDLDDDAAHAAWGGNWCTPTNDDFIELLNNTTSEWTAQNGVIGRKFTGTNGNSIFLPAAGYYLGSNLANAKNLGCYWSSSLRESEPYSAGILYLSYNTAAADYSFYRYVGQTVRPVYKKVVSIDGLIKLENRLAYWDAAYVAKEGYFCYKKDASVNASSESKYHSLTYMPMNGSDKVCLIATKSENIPIQLVTKAGIVYFSFLSDSVLELIYDDGNTVSLLGSMACSKEYLLSLSSRYEGDTFKSLLAIVSTLLKNYTGSSAVSTTYKKYAEVFGTVSNESYVQNDAAVASLKTNASGNYAFAEETSEWYNEVVELIFNTLQIWTGDASFKVGGSSCTLSGTIWCPSDVYNDYGTYGIVCDTNASNLTLGNAEYEGTGFQSATDTGFSVDFRGFKPNTTYYYRAYYKFNSSNHGNITPKHGSTTDQVIYDTTIKSFKTGENILTVDVAMCIDVTASMSDIINTVKNNAISFYDQFKKSCEEEGIQLAALNAQVFAFRDKNVDTNWLQKSNTFTLPSQRSDFNSFVNGLKADGGGDRPESGLEALQAAFNKSDWGVDDGYHRHVVILWTDAPYLVGSSYSDVTLSALSSQWNAMPSGRRLILFAPYGSTSSNGESWGNLDGWTNLIHETDLTNGFNNFDYILKSIIGELTSKAKARMARPIQEETYFRPNE